MGCSKSNSKRDVCDEKCLYLKRMISSKQSCLTSQGFREIEMSKAKC